MAKIRALNWVGIAIVVGFMVIGKLADHFVWDILPLALQISVQAVGAILLLLWLGMQGYDRFLKPGHDEIDFIRIGISDGDLPPT